MSFISYSQNFEDVILWRVLKNIKNGFYIDIGANDPEIDSVTKSFYDKQWNGINIEPDHKLYQKLMSERKRDINLNIAISSKNENIEFHICKNKGWSTTNKENAKNLEKSTQIEETVLINAKTLDNVCKENNVEIVHFLKIDVEGAEKDVIQSFSFTDIRPWIVVVEATKPATQEDVSKEWEYLLLEKDYILVYFDGLNKFYVSKEKEELKIHFELPINIFDNFVFSKDHALCNFEKGENHRLELEVKQYEKTLNHYKATVDVLENKKLKLENDIQELINSKSWKITKPLRVIVSNIKNSKENLQNKIYDIYANIIDNKMSKKLNEITKNNGSKRLLIDVSFIKGTNLNTGIQRVVRNIVKNIEEIKEEKQLEVILVSLNDGLVLKENLNESVKVFDDNALKGKIFRKQDQYQRLVVPNQNDTLLLLDSTWHLNIWESVNIFRSKNSKVVCVVYDLIPIYYPQFCDENLVKMFKKWYDNSIEYVDTYIGISKTVMNDVKKYLSSKNEFDISQKSFDFFTLGADIKTATNKDISYRDNLKEIFNKKSVYLIVSTVEPRKNHKYLFETFKRLWEENIDASLCIVGKVGWKVDSLIEEIKEHPMYNENLFMLNDLNDDELVYCYKHAKSLLFPSFVEGFGLPIVESLQHELPVLASNTEIHNEVGKDLIDYFNIDDPNHLFSIICDIENKKFKLKKVDLSSVKVFNWKESANQLLSKTITNQ